MFCKKQISRFDSTIVALSGKLLNIGYQIKGSAENNFLTLRLHPAWPPARLLLLQKRLQRNPHI